MKNEKPKKNPHAQALAKIRMSALSPEERTAIATHASRAAQAASTPEFRQARAQTAIAARWAGHTSTDPRLDPIAYLLSRGKLSEANLMHRDYSITRARYARRYLLIVVRPHGNGYKNRVDRLLGDGLGCRYTNREHGYIVSVPKTEKFVDLYARGWDANTFSGALIPPPATEKG